MNLWCSCVFDVRSVMDVCDLLWGVIPLVWKVFFVYAVITVWGLCYEGRIDKMCSFVVVITQLISSLILVRLTESIRIRSCVISLWMIVIYDCFWIRYKPENSSLLNTAQYPCLSMNTIVLTSYFAKCDLAFVIFSDVTCLCWLAVVWYIWSLLFFKNYGTHCLSIKKLNVCNKSQYSTIVI